MKEGAWRMEMHMWSKSLNQRETHQPTTDDGVRIEGYGLWGIFLMPYAAPVGSNRGDRMLSLS